MICGNKDVSFSSYFGLLTADEVYNASNLYDNMNNSMLSFALNFDLSYLYRLVPVNFDHTYSLPATLSMRTKDCPFSMSTGGNRALCSDVDYDGDIIPSIVLKTGLKIKSGDGTREHPYELLEI